MSVSANASSGVTFGHEKFARRATHGIEHAFVEHVPRAYLLRDHLGARELGLHAQSPSIGMLLILPETSVPKGLVSSRNQSHIAYLYG